MTAAQPLVPESLLEVAGRVEERIRTVLEAEASRWGGVDPALADLVECLSDLALAGGKRLRPAFCYWAYVGAGGDAAAPTVVDAGAALELLHVFALTHDDIMDGSDRRRGRPTAHVTWTGRHRQEAWRGEARRFGEGVAILLGDLAFVYADGLMGAAPRPARDLYDQLRVELNVGQFLDMVGAARGGVDLAAARRITSYKSGKYTVERPLHLGAALAGRLEELADPLSSYGLALGEAFQLRDDLLGVFGDAGTMGKPVGDDLREGKPTPLMAIAAERATGAAAALLRRVGEPGLSDDEVRDIQEVLESTGARQEVERRIASLTGSALEAAKGAPLVAEAQMALTELAAYAAWRDR